DHNRVSATEEAIPACLEAGIDFIPGIEIDCSYKGIDLHLLGYQINWTSNDFSALEHSVHKRITDSFPEMIGNLSKAGIKVEEEEVLRRANGALPCAEMIAEVLITNPAYHSNPKLQPYLKGGIRSDAPYINFYLDFFAQGKPAYVKLKHMDFSEAIELVKSNQGIPVIAHPGLNLKGQEALVNELLAKGAEGLEVFNNYHDADQIDFFATLAIQKSILMTCGSDFHGKNKPLIDIGQYRFNETYSDYLSKSVKQLAIRSKQK
ncbi:MAG: phosphatase, partial [Bacteroidota bacterium]|nr:phosphatase [Bacteroidota bacterium]